MASSMIAAARVASNNGSRSGLSVTIPSTIAVDVSACRPASIKITANRLRNCRKGAIKQRRNAKRSNPSASMEPSLTKSHATSYQRGSSAIQPELPGSL